MQFRINSMLSWRSRARLHWMVLRAGFPLTRSRSEHKDSNNKGECNDWNYSGVSRPINFPVHYALKDFGPQQSVNARLKTNSNSGEGLSSVESKMTRLWSEWNARSITSRRRTIAYFEGRQLSAQPSSWPMIYKIILSSKLLSFLQWNGSFLTSKAGKSKRHIVQDAESVEAPELVMGEVSTA